MIQLQSKKIFYFFSHLNLLLYFFLLFIWIIICIHFLNNIDTFLKNFYIFSFFWFSFSYVIIYLYQNLLKICIFKKTEKEVIFLLKNTKLPQKLPKVVFLYPTYNDFTPNALLISMQQSYSNIEIWISDESSNINKIKEIDDFAKKHPNINVFRIGNDPTVKTKAQNMNHFLKYSGVNFDYLLVCDVDEVINPFFVENAIKLFYSNKFMNLAIINNIKNVPYYYNNFYSKYISSYSNYYNRFVLYDSNSFREGGNEVFGHCSILSKDFILALNNSFPETLAEDFTTGVICNKWGKQIFSIYLQDNYWLADKSIDQTISRTIRINNGDQISNSTNYNYNCNKKLDSYNEQLRVKLFTIYIAITYFFVLIPVFISNENLYYVLILLSIYVIIHLFIFILKYCLFYNQKSYRFFLGWFLFIPFYFIYSFVYYCQHIRYLFTKNKFSKIKWSNKPKKTTFILQILSVCVFITLVILFNYYFCAKFTLLILILINLIMLIWPLYLCFYYILKLLSFIPVKNNFKF